MLNCTNFDHVYRKYNIYNNVVSKHRRKLKQRLIRGEQLLTETAGLPGTFPVPSLYSSIDPGVSVLKGQEEPVSIPFACYPQALSTCP